MSQIKQLLILHSQGYSIKAIARTLAISKNTVKSYLSKMESGNLQSEALLSLDDPTLETKFHAGNPAYKDSRYLHLKSKLGHFTSELNRVGVTKKLLWEEYIQAYSEGYAYSQFCYHLHQQLVAGKSTSVLTFLPGDKLLVDFAGKQMHYIDADTGEVIACQMFVACLAFSDYAFAMVVPSQRISDFLYALSCCLNDFGGVPKALVPDNLKSAVIKADRYEPQINQSLEDFANHYQMSVVPARSRRPRDKSLVENQVKLLYTRVYAKLRNRQFFDITSLNEAIKERISEHNQTRMQLKDYCRQERFLALEKPLLAPLPQEHFELKYYCEPKVAHSGHVCIIKHFYSVPYALTGTKVKVVYTRNMVHIYAHGNMVAVHIRSYQQGGYSSVKEHLSSQNQSYLDRSPDYYLQRAKSKSPDLYLLVQQVFQQNRYPEQLYRTCDGLFRLHRDSNPDKFAKACQIAIENGIYSYRFLQKILENNMADQQKQATESQPLPAHNNIRGKEYYIQSTINFSTNDDQN